MHQPLLIQLSNSLKQILETPARQPAPRRNTGRVRSAMTSSDMKVCVVGGGIMGASVAYYLSKRGVSCILIEKTQIASAASGKSGGFLARVRYIACNTSDRTPLIQIVGMGKWSYNTITSEIL
jgi:hypothetical protein